MELIEKIEQATNFGFIVSFKKEGSQICVRVRKRIDHMVLKQWDSFLPSDHLNDYKVCQAIDFAMIKINQS